MKGRSFMNCGNPITGEDGDQPWNPYLPYQREKLREEVNKARMKKL